MMKHNYAWCIICCILLTYLTLVECAGNFRVGQVLKGSRNCAVKMSQCQKDCEDLDQSLYLFFSFGMNNDNFFCMLTSSTAYIEENHPSFLSQPSTASFYAPCCKYRAHNETKKVINPTLPKEKSFEETNNFAFMMIIILCLAITTVVTLPVLLLYIVKGQRRSKDKASSEELNSSNNTNELSNRTDLDIFSSAEKIHKDLTAIDLQNSLFNRKKAYSMNSNLTAFPPFTNHSTKSKDNGLQLFVRHNFANDIYSVANSSRSPSIIIESLKPDASHEKPPNSKVITDYIKMPAQKSPRTQFQAVEPFAEYSKLEQSKFKNMLDVESLYNTLDRQEMV